MVERKRRLYGAIEQRDFPTGDGDDFVREEQLSDEERNLPTVDLLGGLGAQQGARVDGNFPATDGINGRHGERRASIDGDLPAGGVLSLGIEVGTVEQAHQQAEGDAYHGAKQSFHQRPNVLLR